MGVSQAHYIAEVVSHFGFTNSHPTSTSININFKLPSLNSPEIDVHDYQSCIGSIMYAMLGTHPDIAYAMGALSQFLANPGADHLTAVNNLLQYLNSVKDFGLLMMATQTRRTLMPIPILIGPVILEIIDSYPDMFSKLQEVL